MEQEGKDRDCERRWSRWQLNQFYLTPKWFERFWTDGKLVPDGEKPDWCPLWELPERITEPIDADDVGRDYSEGAMNGWNACLDAINNKKK